MNLCRVSSFAALLAIASISLAAPSAFADNIVVSYNAAGSQTPNPTTTTYYNTFGTTALSNQTSYTTTFGGSNITGTYTGNFNIVPADAYGGAGGTGDYLQVTYGNTMTLNLTQDGTSVGVNYFGLWFSALDAGNQLSFYNGNTLLLTYTPSDFIAAVGACNGSNPYCGNPNNSLDPNEQFAYLNFTDTTGNDINKIVISQSGSASTADFEADNNAITQNAAVTGTVLGTTPEPSSLALLGTGLTALTTVLRRRKR